MIRAACYHRVSTADQVDGTSLDVQRERTSAYVAAQGWTLVGDFTDGGVSGAKASRPELDRLLGLARSGEVDRLVVTKLDRLGRSTALLAPLLAELDELEVGFVSLAENIDSSTISGQAMRGMLSVFAEMERKVIAERGVSGQRAKAAQGRWPGGTPPFGYRLTGAGRTATPVPDEREREVIRVAYQAVVVDGLSTGETAALLNGLGLVKRSGGLWTHQNLRRQMEALGLTGQVWWGQPTRRHGAGHHTKLKKDGSPRWGQPVRIDLTDPPLTIAQHEVLLAALSRRAYGVKRPDKPYPNSGAASACGGRLGGVYRVERDLRQYRCSQSKWRADTDERCACARVDAGWLDTRVWGAVVGLLADPEALTAMADDYLGAACNRAGIEAGTMADLDRRIGELDRAMTSRAADALKAGLPSDVLAAAVAELGMELKALRTRREAIVANRADAVAREARADAMRRLSRDAAARLPGLALDAQREVLQLLQLRVTLLDGTNRPAVRIEGELPRGGLALGVGGGDSPPPIGGLAAALHAWEPNDVAPRRL